jgi:hypothetical protein
MKVRLSCTLCRGSQFGGFSNGQRVRVAPMMMHVVHQRNGEPFAER